MRVRILGILFVFLMGTSSLSAFRLNRVILSTNNDPKYIQFWPIVAPLWKAMGLHPTLALIGDEDCEIDTTIGDVIRFHPIPDIPESLQAQTIRLFLPALFPEDVCLVSDIDMLPLSRAYYIDGAAACPEDAFLVYRDCAYGCGYPRYPMCYIAAMGKTFASVFSIYSRDDITTRISNWAEWGLGWETDELLLYHYLQDWKTAGGEIVRLGHDVGPRIDRGNWPYDCNNLDLKNYIDCHCPRPYSDYEESINQIAKAVLEII